MQEDPSASASEQEIEAKILNPDEALDEIYVDGAFNLQVHENIAKFEFFNIAASVSGERSWRRTHRLVMPLSAAPRLMIMLQQMMEELRKSGRLRVNQEKHAAGAK